MPDSPSFDKASLAWALPWEDAWVTAVTFAGEKRRLVAGNRLGQMLAWDLPEKAGEPRPAPVRRLDGHTNAITRLIPLPDGRRVVSASFDHTIRVWDLEAPAAGSAEVILDARDRAEAARKQGKKALPPAPGVKVETQPAERVLEGHKDWVQALALGRDGKTLVSGDDGGQVVVWDMAAGKETRRWKLKGWAYGMALSPDSAQIVISERIPLVFDRGRLAAVKLWDAATGQVKQDWSAQFKVYISCAAFSPDGKWVALGRGGESESNCAIYLMDPANGKKVRELPGQYGGVTEMAFSADGRYLFSCGRDTVLRVWQVADGKKVAELGKPRGGQFKDWLHALSLSSDERWLAAADMAGQVLVYAS